MASARAAGGQPSEGATAMAVAVAGSSIRSTTITGRSKAADSAVAVAPVALDEERAARQLQQPIGQACRGVVAVPGDDGDAETAAEQLAQLRLAVIS